MRRISVATRDELLKAVASDYRCAARAEKGRILTEFAEISGYHRKHAERVLRRRPVDRSPSRPERWIYDEAILDGRQGSEVILGRLMTPFPVEWNAEHHSI